MSHSQSERELHPLALNQLQPAATVWAGTEPGYLSRVLYIASIALMKCCFAWGRLSLNVGVSKPFSTENGSGER